MTPSGWVGTFYIMNAICLIDIAVFESFIFPLLVLVSCVFQRTGSGTDVIGIKMLVILP